MRVSHKEYALAFYGEEKNRTEKKKGFNHTILFNLAVEPV